MNEDWTMNVIWWISAVELPVMAGLFWLFWSGQRETDEDLDRIRLDIEHGLARSNEALSAFKLEVAKSYASISTLKDVEKRLTQHLLRIELKLDGAAGGRP